METGTGRRRNFGVKWYDLTCHGIFSPSVISVRPMGRTDYEEGTTDGRAGYWHLAGASGGREPRRDPSQSNALGHPARKDGFDPRIPCPFLSGRTVDNGGRSIFGDLTPPALQKLAEAWAQGLDPSRIEAKQAISDKSAKDKTIPDYLGISSIEELFYAQPQGKLDEIRARAQRCSTFVGPLQEVRPRGCWKG